ncbi:MAG: undecaprenyl-phosphate glucose phosphotransferase, partial [Gorillibacterium sp.]|nr:undecaprenyl-phosphate glucose phosphotransferase [Gorillibacterium sp.]
MIHRNQHLMHKVYALCDFLVIQLFFLAAWWYKFQSPWANVDSASRLSSSRYYQWGFAYSVIVIFLGFFMQFYAPKRKKTFAFEAWKLIQIHIISFLILLSLLFVAKEIDISREFLAVFITMNICGTLIYRLWVKFALRSLRRKGFNKQYILIIGAGSLGRRFYKKLTQSPELGYDVYG